MSNKRLLDDKDKTWFPCGDSRSSLSSTKFCSSVCCARFGKDQWKLISTETGLTANLEGHRHVDFVWFGYADEFDDYFFAPNAMTSSIVTAIRLTDDICIDVLKNEFPFNRVDLVSPAKIPVNDVSTKRSFYRGRREMSVLLLHDTVYWFYWAFNARKNEAKFVMKQQTMELGDSECTAMQICRKDSILVSLSNGKIVLFPSSISFTLKDVHNGFVAQMMRISSRVCLAVVKEQERESLRLFLIQSWNKSCSSVELSLPFLCRGVSLEPSKEDSFSAPSSSLFHASNLSEIIALLGNDNTIFFASCHRAIGLLEAHAIDQSNLPLPPTSLNFEKTIVTEERVASFYFVRPKMLLIVDTKQNITALSY